MPTRTRHWLSRVPNTRWLGWVTAAMLGSCAVFLWGVSFGPQGGIDFYHYWGIAAVRKAHGHSLGTPYTDAERYAAILNGRADTSTDTHFKTANQARRTIDPTGTPLFYASFVVLPTDYTRSHAWFRAAQFVALSAGLTMWCCALGLDLSWALCVAFVVALAYQPAHSEARVGNVNSLQLLACVGLALRAQGLGRHRSPLLAGSAVLSAAVAFVLFKPNLALVPLMLGPRLLQALGRRSFVKAFAAACLVALALVATTSAWMGSPRAWIEWWAFITGPGGGKLTDYPVADGNFATPLLLAGVATSARVHLTSLCVATVLAISWLSAAGFGSRVRGSRLVSDPLFLVSSALIITMAAAPLMWLHYCVLALLPCLWLVFGRRSVDVPAWLGLLSLGLYSGFAPPFIWLLGFEEVPLQVLAWSVGFGWIPVWVGLLLVLVRPGGGPIPDEATEFTDVVSATH